MPGAARSMRGAAAFVTGFLDQDRDQQEQQLELLETLAGTAATAQNIRGAQATQRRADALFPGELQQQGLTTTQMGLTTQDQQRSSEMQKSLDDIILETYGLPSFEIFKALNDAGEVDFLTQKREEMLRLNAPQVQAQAEVIPQRQEIDRLTAFGEGGGPTSTGTAQAIGAEGLIPQSQFQRDVAQFRAEGPLARETAQTELGLERLKVPQARADVGLTQAQAELARKKRFEGKAGEEELKRIAFVDRYGEIEGNKRYYEGVIIGQNIDLGRTLPIQDINRGLADIEMALFNLEKPETTDPMAALMLATIMKSSSGMFGSTDPAAQEGKSIEEVKEILMPMFQYYNTLHAELDPEGRSYTDISLAPTGTAQPGAAQQPGLDRATIDTALQSFRATDQKKKQIGDYLELLGAKYEPRQWEVLHQTNKHKFLRDLNEADWQETLLLIRQLQNQPAGGTQ